MRFDHILVIGFGGPTKPQEVQPFLERVTRGVRLPAARRQEVLHHYEAVGGYSRYNEETSRVVEKLEGCLRACGISQPVLVGMRNWHPFLQDVMVEIRRRGLRRGIGVVLAPHRSDASFDRYLRSVEEAKAHASAHEIHYEYLPPWFEHPLFIEAQADEVRKALEAVPVQDREATPLVFTAHSIPTEMAARCRYAQEIELSSREVARVLDHPRWRVAYQSRSGSPSQPWLEPEVASVLRELRLERARAVVVVPIGFLCEHVEVLFDLDIEARQQAERLGLRFSRASTVRDHPQVVEMFTQLIQEALQASVGRV